jgi:hypothetical protein
MPVSNAAIFENDKLFVQKDTTNNNPNNALAYKQYFLKLENIIYFIKVAMCCIAIVGLAKIGIIFSESNKLSTTLAIDA